MWDLDGFISMSEIDALKTFNEEELCQLYLDYKNRKMNLSLYLDEVSKEVNNLLFFYPFLLYKILFFNSYKKTEKYSREIALGLNTIEFTTTLDIYTNTGVESVVIEDDNLMFIGSSDMLIYFKPVLKSLIYSFANENTSFVIKDLGNRKITYEDDIYFISKFLDVPLIHIEYDGVTKDEVFHFLYS